MDILQEIEKLKKKIAELEKETKKESCVHWEPKVQEDYFYVSGSGEVFISTWLATETDADRYSLENCFRSRKEAEFAAEKLKVIAELKDYEEKDAVWDGSNRHYYILFDIEDKKIKIYGIRNAVSQGAIFFASEEDVKKAIEAVGEDRIKKYIFGR